VRESAGRKRGEQNQNEKRVFHFHFVAAISFAASAAGCSMVTV